MCVFQSVSNVVWRYACAMAAKCLWVYKDTAVTQGQVLQLGATVWHEGGEKRKTVRRSEKKNKKHHHTDDKGFFWLRPVLVIPGRSASGVDGACARAEQRRLGFTQWGSALPARGPGGGQEPVQRVLPTPTAKTQTAGQVTAWTHRQSHTGVVFPFYSVCSIRHQPSLYIQPHYKDVWIIIIIISLMIVW